jgi:hypothetical protein
VIKVHLKGTFCATLPVFKWMRDNGGGVIVNTSSTSGILGASGQANYGAAKAGIAAFTQIVAMEMQRYGVRVNAIAPGARTRMTENTFGDLLTPEGQFDALAPENIAPMVAYLASDAAAGVTGQVFGVTGGLIQLYQGWTPVGELRKDARWEPSELASRMAELFDRRTMAYSPERSPLRQLQGLGGPTGAPEA